jgi:predicted outer membrane repeat protein
LDNQIQDSEGELTLDSDITFEDGEDCDYLVLENDIVIDGKNHVIDAGGKAGIFKIHAENVTLKNIVFKNAGSSAIVNGEGLLKICGCEFIDNKSDANGGAVFNEGTLKAFDCRFISNASKNSGGAVYSTFGSFFKDCLFKDNRSENDGAAVCNKSALKAILCRFTHNTSQANGGAAYTNGFGHFGRCEFSENSADGCGGAVENEYLLRVFNSVFEENTAKGNGGSINFREDTLSIVDGCEFLINSSECNGGAACTNGFTKFENSTFTDNVCTDKGGALRVGKEGYLFIAESVEFDENKAEMGNTYSFYTPKNINDETDELHMFHADYFCVPLER